MHSSRIALPARRSALQVRLLCAPTSRQGAHEPGLPAGQGAALPECGFALRPKGLGLHPDEPAAAAPQAPGPGRARLPPPPFQASGKRQKRRDPEFPRAGPSPRLAPAQPHAFRKGRGEWRAGTPPLRLRMPSRS